jgi:hypothetical protein
LLIGDGQLHIAGGRNRALCDPGVDKLLQVGTKRQAREAGGLDLERDPERGLDRHAAVDPHGALRGPSQRQLQRHHRAVGEGDVLERALQIAETELRRPRRRQIGEVDPEILQRHLSHRQIERRGR